MERKPFTHVCTVKFDGRVIQKTRTRKPFTRAIIRRNLKPVEATDIDIFGSLEARTHIIPAGHVECFGIFPDQDAADKRYMRIQRYHAGPSYEFHFVDIECVEL